MIAFITSQPDHIGELVPLLQDKGYAIGKLENADTLIVSAELACRVLPPNKRTVQYVHSNKCYDTEWRRWDAVVVEDEALRDEMRNEGWCGPIAIQSLFTEPMTLMELPALLDYLGERPKTAEDLDTRNYGPMRPARDTRLSKIWPNLTFGEPLRWRSISDLGASIRQYFATRPRPDIVSGLPRSGAMAALYASQCLEVPYVDIKEVAALPAGKRVTVMDDSIDSGRRLKDAMLTLKDAACDITYVVAYANKAEHDLPKRVEIMEVVPLPRAFEWEVLHHQFIGECAFDYDEVLTAYTPSAPIGWIVSGRLERERKVLEQDARARGIVYKSAFLRPNEIMGKAEFKASVYKDLPAWLFIESDIAEAQEIYERTGKPVLHYGTMKIWGAIR